MTTHEIESEFRAASVKLHKLLDEYLANEITVDELKAKVWPIAKSLPSYYYDEDDRVWRPCEELDSEEFTDEFNDLFTTEDRFSHHGSNSFIACLIPSVIEMNSPNTAEGMFTLDLALKPLGINIHLDYNPDVHTVNITYTQTEKIIDFVSTHPMTPEDWEDLLVKLDAGIALTIS